MSHEVETGFFTGTPAWHGVGNVLKDAPDSRTAIVSAGLDWNVEERQVFCSSWKDLTASLQGSPDPLIPIENRKALVRAKDNRVLGVVSTDYKVLQNLEAFEIFDPLIRDGQLSYEAAGSLYRGEKIWVLAKFNGTFEVGKGDAVQSYLLLVNGHDGKTGILNLVTPIRVVCRNTLQQALAQGEEKLLKIAHRGNLQAKIEAAQAVLGVARKQFEDLGTVFQKLLATPVDAPKAREYVNRLVPLSLEPGDRERARVVKERGEIHRLAQEGRGTSLPGVQGSVWGLYNAAVEFADFEKSPGVKDRTSFLLVGEGQRFKRQAYSQALDLAGVE